MGIGQCITRVMRGIAVEEALSVLMLCVPSNFCSSIFVICPFSPEKNKIDKNSEKCIEYGK